MKKIFGFLSSCGGGRETAGLELEVHHGDVRGLRGGKLGSIGRAGNLQGTTVEAASNQKCVGTDEKLSVSVVVDVKARYRRSTPSYLLPEC